MKTSSANKNNSRCPECDDHLTQDTAKQGFVRHKNNPNCDFERGERDHPTRR